MNLTPYEFEKAQDGSLFIKKGKHLVAISFNELSQDLKKEVSKIANLERKVEVNSKCIEQLQKTEKQRFITVFTLFELKALKNEIEVSDETLLNLDEEVIADHISVSDAINKHDYLKQTYFSLYGEKEAK